MLDTPGPRISFGSRFLGPEEGVIVVAEIGVNHEGDEESCVRMIRAAADAGADAVKLQTIDAAENYAPDTESYAIFSRAQLSRDATERMFDLAKEVGVEIFTTAGDMDTLAWVDSLDPAAHKISSGLLDHLPLIQAAAKTGRPLVMSTGMSDLGDVDAAVDAAGRAGCREIALLQCTSLYPAPPEQSNLRAIQMLADRYGVPVGFSDHTEGTDIGSLAVAAGACMIEKHFSLDPTRAGFDHKISLDPAGFEELVAKVRNTERVMGSAAKELSQEERAVATRYRRCLVARRTLPPGTMIGDEDVAVMRVREKKEYLPPSVLAEVIGNRTVVEVAEFAPIANADLERPVRLTEPLDQGA